MGTPQNSISVYRLIPAEMIAQQVTALGERLFKIRSSGGNSERIYVSPLSGCMLYMNYGLLRNRGADPLPSSDDALTMARKFLEESNRAIAQKPLGTLGQIFPTTLQHVITMPVYAPGQSNIDHWTVRFIAFLDTGTGDRQATISAPDLPQKPVAGTILPPSVITIADSSGSAPAAPIPGSAPVAGGIVEIRVGGSGKIVGVNSRWRPFQSTELTKMLPVPSDSSSTNYQLVYLLGGDEEPQEFIAPYYRSQDESDPDNGSYFPASDRSMLVDFFREDGSDATTLTASVSGNAGPLRYSWGAWRIDLGPSAGFESVGTESAAMFTQGAYNVVLDVQDTLTGAFVRAQALVYCGPKPSRPAE